MAPAPKPFVAPLAPSPSSASAPAALPTYGGGLRVSLLPTDLEGTAAPDFRQRLIILALVLVIETLAFGIGYFFVVRAAGNRTAEGEVLTRNIAQLNAEIDKKEADAKSLVAWSAQRDVAEKALDSHVRFSSIFTYLESKTLPGVTYHSFSGDTDSGTVTLDAVAPTYRDVAQQIVSLRADPMVQDIRTTSASASVDAKGQVIGVSFTMVLQLDSAVWIKK
ncbi:MAG: hypothetical protein RLZZ324_666 [Candidatus Parcubacteria bacterium]|jgi:Tfp pilus assembly protein PilN